MILVVLVAETYVLKHLENMVDLVVLFGTRLISSRSTSEGFGFSSHFPLNQPRAVGRVDMKQERCSLDVWKLVALYSVPHFWG